jgi:hypothetical protein
MERQRNEGLIYAGENWYLTNNISTQPLLRRGAVVHVMAKERTMEQSKKTMVGRVNAR